MTQAARTPRRARARTSRSLSWQIVPRRFNELIGDENPKKVQAVMGGMMGMVKLDVAGLEKAYAEA